MLGRSIGIDLSSRSWLERTVSSSPEGSTTCTHGEATGRRSSALTAIESTSSECLDRVVQRTNLRCLGYCLMSNHYHLMLETHDGELSRAIQRLNGRYALRFNRRYDRDAHLFKNRFGAVHQQSESQLIWTLRYIVMNPVDKGLCGAPEEWRWSSYRASVGIDRAPRFLDVNGLLSLFGDGSERSRAQYRACMDGLVGV